MPDINQVGAKDRQSPSCSSLSASVESSLRDYSPPPTLFSPFERAQQTLKVRIFSFVEDHGITVKPSGHLSIDLRDSSPNDFVSAATYLCKALFGPYFKMPTAAAEWKENEVYAPAQCATRRLLSFPLLVDSRPNDAGQGALPPQLLPLRAPDLQVAYAALSLVRGSELLAERYNAVRWREALERTPSIQQLRAAERRIRSEEFRRHDEKRDPLASAIRCSIENGNNTVVSIHEDLQRHAANQRYSPRNVRQKLSEVGFPNLRIRNARLNELLERGGTRDRLPM